MRKFAQVLNCLGLLLVLAFAAFNFHIAYSVGWDFASVGPLILCIPYVTALVSLSTKPRTWIFALALLANGMLALFGFILLLGELAWHMFGTLAICGFAVFVVIPGILNFILISKVRSASAKPQPTEIARAG